MLDFYQKRKLRAIANSRITQGILVLVVGFLLWNAFERYTVAQMMADRRIEVEQTAATLQARKESLEAEVRYLQDERGIEAEMRRQFDIALPGEEVVVIVEDDEENLIQPLATTTVEAEADWWPFW